MPSKAAVPVKSPQPAQQPTEQPVTAAGVGSVDRALSLLGAFTVDRPSLSLSELADGTQQYKSTVLRLLASLEAAHLVRRHDDGRYVLGSAVARLNAIYCAAFSFGELVLPALQDLVAATRESAAFHVRQGERELCLYRIDSPHPVRDHGRAGDLCALADSIAGRVMLAYGGNAADGKNGAKSGAKPGGVLAARIRKAQWLIVDGDIVPELAGIAAPVFQPDGQLAGVLVLTMPSLRFMAAHAPAAQQAARSITEKLGGSYPPAGRR